MKYCMIIVTCPSEAQAQDLASGIIEKRLAACVQLSPITSFYVWKGKVHKDPEIRLTIKTRSELYDPLEKFIVTCHGYEVPQIIQVPIEKGLPAYLEWIAQTTGGL